MSRVLSAILVAVLGFVALIFAGVSELQACGDKFIVGVRGSQYLGSFQLDPARILVYWPLEPGSDPKDRGDSAFEASLRKAGHSVQVVEDSKSLYLEAESGSYEIILMDVVEAREKLERIEGVAPDSTLLPVLNFPTRSEYSAAKKEFGHAIKAPTTVGKLLSQIDRIRVSSR